MKLNIQRLLEHCIDEGIEDALKIHGGGNYDENLAEKISNMIWLSLDYYFNFEEDN